MLAYILALSPTLYRHHADISTLIVAGDKYVDSAATPSPIIVRPHSAGYDGQFYYKIALHPFALVSAADGVTFDHPAWRLQRICYPLVSYLVAFGQAQLVPAALFASNVAALFTLAWLAFRSCLVFAPAWSSALTLVLWPGFMIALTHDTTELLACALLLAAILAYLDKRYFFFACTGALAALTRETCSLMLAGIFLTEGWRALRSLWRSHDISPSRQFSKVLGPTAAAAATLLPFAAWHILVALQWKDAAQAAPIHANVGWPLAGAAERLAASLSEAFAAGAGIKARLIGAYEAATSLFIIVFSCRVVIALPKLWRRGGETASLATGCSGMMILLSLLSSHGPWIEPTAIFRAFSEVWVVGWVLLPAAGRRTGNGWSLALMPLAIMNWSVCMTQLR